MDWMAHFDAASCADFVRGTLGPRQHKAMERHVVTCRSCAATVGWLREIAEAAAIDQESEPPAHLLRHTRALFTARRRRTAARSRRRR
jgi:anti-sigma-K factor RskA